MKIKACPVCGQEVEHSCYHDGDDVQSIEMEISHAFELVKEYIVYVNQIIESAKYDLQKYNDIANDYAAQHLRAVDGLYCQHCGELLSSHLVTERGGHCQPAHH